MEDYYPTVLASFTRADRLYALPKGYTPVVYFYNRALRVGPGFTNPPGYSTIATLRKGIGSQVVDTGAMPELTWKDIVNQGFVVTGTPDSVAQQLNEMADVMVQHLAAEDRLEWQGVRILQEAGQVV